MKAPYTLVLVAGTYPFDGEAENTFLDPEMGALCEAFERVVLAPGSTKGRRLPVPGGADVDESLARARAVGRRRLGDAVRGLRWPFALGELIAAGRLGGWPGVRQAVAALANAETTLGWARQKVESGEYDPSRTLFYTYWFDFYTVGLCLLKRQFRAVKVVSRAHNFDIYEERHVPPRIPFRGACADMLDWLFPISAHGRDYLVSRYPQLASKISVARLGVAAARLDARASDDGVFRVVSCSYLSAVKRVELLYEGLLFAAKQRPSRIFEWLHIGDGQGLERYRGEATRGGLPNNLRLMFPGRMANAEVVAHYEGGRVDLFANVSAFEGIPVSIMEAQSHGIPVLATAVGGSPEVVTSANGELLPPHPTSEMIGAAIVRLSDDPEGLAQRRSVAKATWHELTFASRNFAGYAEALAKVRGAEATPGR
jgi:glycosyltransferase involved in cell wall biosynthesis